LTPFEPPAAFDEPWQAQAFALVVALHDRGAFTWPEWAAALSARIKAAEASGPADYHACWLAALEDLVAVKGLAGTGELAARKVAWAEAYRHTPHGAPVELVGH
jgi:nitrile hydratase accessory protein